MVDLKMLKTLDELFEEWKEAHSCEEKTEYLGPSIPKNVFLPDGIIDEEKFDKQELKVLFVAKEANWYQADENPELSKPVETMFWHRRVAFDEVPKTMFSYRLSMLTNALLSKEENRFTKVDKTHEGLQSVAVINLNKRGGYSYCVWETLNTYVAKYQDYIRREIELISPDMIVCCGYDVKWLIDEYSLAPNVDEVIWIYHPSYFAISDPDYLKQLECAITGTEWKASKRDATAENYGKAETKGIVFDTNKSYSELSTMEMLLGNKVSAYGRAAHFVDSFNIGDYAFFSVKGVGIVAAGKVISDIHEEKYLGEDGETTTERYKVVEFIVPTAEQMPHGEEELKAIWWSKATEILDHRFYHARTDKRPYLTEDECEKLINELRKLYA